MPAENVTVPLRWWKLSDNFAMMEALDELFASDAVRGSVGVGPVDAEGAMEWRLQFNWPGVESAFVGKVGEFVTAIGNVVEIISEATFVERYPTITVPGGG